MAATLPAKTIIAPCAAATLPTASANSAVENPLANQIGSNTTTGAKMNITTAPSNLAANNRPRPIGRVRHVASVPMSASSCTSCAINSTPNTPPAPARLPTTIRIPLSQLLTSPPIATSTGISTSLTTSALATTNASHAPTAGAICRRSFFTICQVR